MNLTKILNESLGISGKFKTVHNSQTYKEKILENQVLHYLIYYILRKPPPSCAGSHRRLGLGILSTFDERIGDRGN